MIKKRYILTLDLYLFAEDDESAKKQADLIAEELKKTEDNNASVVSLGEQPYGKLEYREIHKQ